MDFDYTDKVKKLQKRVSDFMDANVHPNEDRFRREIAEGDRWQPTRVVEELKEKARAAGLWNLFLPESEYGAGLTQPRVRAARRDHGSLRDGVGGLQLLGARHRQHGGARPLRQRRAEEAVARAAPRRQDPLRVRDDRARRRLVGRDQHPGEHPPRRRRLRHQRPQVVDVGRRRSALQDPDRHGQDGARQPGPLSPAVDDPGAARHPGREGRAHAHRLRLRRRAPRPRGGELRERPRAGVEHAPRRGPRLRDRPGTSRSRPHPSLHAHHRRRRARARGDVQAPHDPRRLRQGDRPPQRLAAAHRRRAHRHRAVPPPHAEGGAT